MTKKIKVIHIITRLILGGAQENTYLTTKLLDKNKYEVILISGPTFGEEGSIEDKVKEEKIRLIIIQELTREISLLQDLIAFLKLYGIIKKEKPDIVHTHTSKAGILGRFAAKISGVPIIIHTPHGHVFQSYYGFFKTKLFLFLERFASVITDKIITLTDVEKEEHLQFKVGKREKFITIFSGVELDKFLNVNVNKNKKREELGLNKDDKVLCCVARLVPVKGHKYLIEAMPKILKEIPNVKLLIIGDGELRQDLENLAKNIGIADKIIFLGLRFDVPELLSILDLFVLPSLNEGMGKVLIEAMACSLPVVASEVGGIKEIVINNETGMLVPPKDSEKMAKNIVYLLNDDELAKKMGIKGKQRALEFSSNVMVEKINKLYKEMLEKKKK